MTLLGISLLVALIFYVYNVGDQVNDRVVMQNAADSAAVSGAGWIARSMNTTAMNNVASTRVLGILPVLDAFPLASEMAIHEVDTLADGLDYQARSVEDLLKIISEPGLERSLPGIRELADRLRAQGDIIRPFEKAINSGGFRMEQVTCWRVPGMSGGPPHGTIWRAAKALEEYSQATLDSAGILAQFNARRFGRMNEAQTAILIPVIPVIPNRLGTYNDFQPTIEGYIRVWGNSGGSNGTMRRTGGNGGGIPDFAYFHRLGPWARMYPWRNVHISKIPTGSKLVNAREKIPGTGKPERIWIPGQAGRRRVIARGGKQPLPGRGSSARRGSRAGQASRGGHWATRTSGHQYRTVQKQVTTYKWVTDGYTTYGPFYWAMQRVLRYSSKYLADTKFGMYTQNIANIKLDYMFPAKGPKIEKTIHYPNWIIDYAKAKELASIPETRVTETMLYFFDIASSVPESSGKFLSPGTFRTNGSLALASRRAGWHDAATFDGLRPDAKPVSDKVREDGTPICNYIWKSTDWYETTEDPEIGIEYKGPGGVDPDTGEPITAPVFQKVYVVEYCMFGAVDVGGDVAVANPCNWSDSEVDDLPAPFLINTEDFEDYNSDNPDVDLGVRRTNFAFLALARSPSEAPLWSQRFSGANPTRAITTLAQAKVFNNTSWGLWTQDWQVQLTPVNRWEDWVERVADGSAQTSQTYGAVSARDLEEILQYLRALTPEFAEKFTGH